MTIIFIAVLSILLTGFMLWGSRKRQRRLGTIEVVTLPAVTATQLENQRDIRVYLPPGYRERERERFEVLYINDGQECDALELRGTLARLSAAGRIRPIIAVAIPTNENRLHEYGTAVAANDLGLGTLAQDYAHFLVNELMPRIDEAFRTRPGAGLLGVSLGGLSAFDIAWNHPELFSVVGVLSGSFWWRAGNEEEKIDAGQRIAHSMARRTAHPPPVRFFFQAGTRDEVSDRDGNGVIDAIQDTQELIAELQATGCSREQILYVEILGGRHDFETWARVLPIFLEWAFSSAPVRQTRATSFDDHLLR